MFRRLVFSVLFLIGINGIYSQDISKKPQINVDFVQFKGDSARTKLEIYQSIRRDNLVYKKHGNKVIANFKLQTKIILADSVLADGAIVETDTLNNLNELTSGQQFVYTLPFLMKPGKYEIVSLLTDLNSTFESKSNNVVEISSFSPDSLELSEIQFAMSIKPATANPSHFDKNNLRILPNPQNLFGDGLENIAFYCELYNLELFSNESGFYHVDYIIEDRDGNLLYRIPGKKRGKKDSDAAIYTSFDISSLISSRYFLHLKTVDEDNQKVASKKKMFTVFRKKDAIAEYQKKERETYESLDEDALDGYFDQVSYIANDQEKMVFKELNLQGKREFLVNFWNRRDPTPGTPVNEYKDDYILRLLKTKVNFTVSETEGWKTDRGRILLQYGIPDFIDRNEGLSDRNAYEVWDYETLQSGAIFIFVEIRSDGIYQLVHSTFRDEISNPNWQTYLYR